MADEFWAHMSAAPSGLGVEDPIATNKRLKAEDPSVSGDPKSAQIPKGPDISKYVHATGMPACACLELMIGVFHDGGDFDGSKPGAAQDVRRFITHKPTNGAASRQKHAKPSDHLEGKWHTSTQESRPPSNHQHCHGLFQLS